MTTEQLKQIHDLRLKEIELMKELKEIRQQLAALKQPKQSTKRTKHTNSTESFLKMSRAIIESRNGSKSQTTEQLNALSKKELINILDNFQLPMKTNYNNRTKKELIDLIINIQKGHRRGEAFLKAEKY